MLVLVFAVGTAYASDVDVTVDTGESGNWEEISITGTPGSPAGSVPGVTWSAATQTLTLNNAKVYGVSISVHSRSITKVQLVVQGTNTLGHVFFAGTKSGPAATLVVSGSGTLKFAVEDSENDCFDIATLAEAPMNEDEPDGPEDILDTTKDLLQIAGATIKTEGARLCSTKTTMTGGTVYVPSKRTLPKSFTKTGGTVYYDDEIAIVYHLNGGKTVPGFEDDSDIIYVGDKLTEDYLMVPVRYGYHFVGWRTNKALTAKVKKTKVTASTTGELHFYAKWKKISGKKFWIAEKYGKGVSAKTLKRVNKALGKLPKKRLKEYIMLGGSVYVVGKNKRKEAFEDGEVGNYRFSGYKTYGLISLDYQLGTDLHAVSHEFGHWNEAAHAKRYKAKVKKLWKKYRSQIRSCISD